MRTSSCSPGPSARSSGCARLARTTAGEAEGRHLARSGEDRSGHSARESGFSPATTRRHRANGPTATAAPPQGRTIQRQPESVSRISGSVRRGGFSGSARPSRRKTPLHPAGGRRRNHRRFVSVVTGGGCPPKLICCFMRAPLARPSRPALQTGVGDRLGGFERAATSAAAAPGCRQGAGRHDQLQRPVAAGVEWHCSSPTRAANT